PRYRGCVLFRDSRIAERHRARCGDVAGDVEQVLDRDRDARESARGSAECAQVIMEICRRQRLLPMHLEKRARPLSCPVVDAREAFFNQLTAFFPALNPLYRFCDGMHVCSFAVSRGIFIGSPRGNSSFDLPFSPATLAPNAISIVSPRAPSSFSHL